MCMSGADLGEVAGGAHPTHPPPLPPTEVTCGFLLQRVFCAKKKKKTMWFIGVEVEQETNAPLPTKNPGSAPVCAKALST